MLSPVPGSTFTSSGVTFSWSAGSATAYILLVGSSPNGSDIYNSGQVQVLSATVNNIPTNGQAIYVTLASLVNGSWTFESYTYTAFNSSAIPTPTPAPTPAPTPTPTPTLTLTPTPTPTAAPTFSLSISPSTVNLRRSGGQANYTVTINATGGFSSTVQLSVSGLPSGTTGSFSPDPATTSSTLTLNVSPSTAAGSYIFTVSGTSGTVTYTATGTLKKNNKR